MGKVASQSKFFERQLNVRHILQTFDHIIGMHYFVKDCDSRIMAVSPGFVARMGFENESEMIGLLPHDYLPTDLAEKYLEDDRRVIRTGRSLENIVEMGYFELKIREWIITNKYPLFSKNGKTVGLIGTIHSFTAGKRQINLAGPAAQAASFISENLTKPIPLHLIADHVGYSTRQLERIFQKIFRMTVKQYIIESKIHFATREITQTDKSITEISASLGFCDSSAFSNRFKSVTGFSPRSYRELHQK